MNFHELGDSPSRPEALVPLWLVATGTYVATLLRRDQSLTSLRRGWLTEFEQLFKKEFAAAFRGDAGRDWSCAVSASDWSASAVRAADGRTISINLPYNYLLFRPASVAQNIAARLYERAMAAQGDLEPTFS